MNKWMLVVGLLACLPSPAMAADEMPTECRLLGPHTPDRGVAYQPGVDVHGKPVVPADLGAAPSAMPLPQTIVVPLGVDLAQRLQNVNVPGLQLEAPLGMLEIHGNGRVVYNGQEVTQQIYPLCAQPLPTNLQPPAHKPDVPTAGDGQNSANTIKSDTVEIAPVQAVPPGSVVIEGSESREEGYR